MEVKKNYKKIWNGFYNILTYGKELKGIIRVSFTLKDKEQDKEKDKDINKAELIKFLKVS